MSSKIFNREYREHERTYGKFDLIHVVECDNNIKVEDLFKQELSGRKLLRKMEFNNKIRVELFTTTNANTLDNLKKLLNNLVKTNELPKLIQYKKKIDEYKNNKEIKIEEEKTKQDRLRTDRKKMEVEISKIESNKMEIELEIIKIKLDRDKLKLEMMKIKVERRKKSKKISEKHKSVKKIKRKRKKNKELEKRLQELKILRKYRQREENV